MVWLGGHSTGGLLRLRWALVVVLMAALLAPGCSVGVQRTPSGAEAGAAGDLTVVLVRHAEKVDESSDAALSEAGLRRAEALASVLADAGITAVYTTQYQRTVNTAAPLARQVGVQPQVVQTSGTAHAADVAARVRQHTTGSILVVGHSNTVPAIIRELGGPAVTIADDEYHHLFILKVTSQGTRLIRASF